MLTLPELAACLQVELRNQLPGQPAQNRMLVRPQFTQSVPFDRENARPSAVMICLFPRKNDIHMFLTKRTEDVEHHKGQISLPGGAWEAGETISQTALRETEEEIGVPPVNISVQGEMTSLFVPITGFVIHPFVGTCEREPVTDPDPDEVHELFSVSLSALLDDKSLQHEEWTLRNRQVEVPYFQFGRHKVWGATSMILSEFREVLKRCL